MPSPRDSADILTEDAERVVAAVDRRLRALDGADLLITGGAGFVGYEMIGALVHHNRTRGGDVRITVADNLSRGEPAWLRALVADGAVRLVRHDVRDPLPAGLPPFAYVVHAASIASPSFYRRRPIETMDANVVGLRLLLDDAAARADGPDPVRSMLFFSTSEIYGDPTPDQIPTPETYRGNVSCTGPRACYDESKRYGETLCVNFCRSRGVPVAVARPFNNYGPGLPMGDGRVISDLMSDVIEGRDIELLSDGSPTRTFCYVSDAVTGYLQILLAGRQGEAYNIGAEAPEISMLELAERVAATGREVAGYEGRVVTAVSDDVEYLADNPVRRCPVIDKARRELDYEPVVELGEGLRRTLHWYLHDAERTGPRLGSHRT